MGHMSNLHAAAHGADPFVSLARLALAQLQPVDLFDLLADSGREPPADSRDGDSMRLFALVFAESGPGLFVRAVAPYLGAADDDPLLTDH